MTKDLKVERQLSLRLPDQPHIKAERSDTPSPASKIIDLKNSRDENARRFLRGQLEKVGLIR